MVHEVARAYIDELLMSGKTLEDITADKFSFEREILLRKLEIEAGLPAEETIFFDRGLPDSIAYFKSAGLDFSEPLKSSRYVCYRKIFHFQRLKFRKDHVRAEDEKLAENLNELLIQSYETLGYNIIHVPVLSVEERIDFILKRLQ